MTSLVKLVKILPSLPTGLTSTMHTDSFQVTVDMSSVKVVQIQKTLV